MEENREPLKQTSQRRILLAGHQRGQSACERKMMWYLQEQTNAGKLTSGWKNCQEEAEQGHQEVEGGTRKEAHGGSAAPVTPLFLHSFCSRESLGWNSSDVTSPVPAVLVPADTANREAWKVNTSLEIEREQAASFTQDSGLPSQLGTLALAAAPSPQGSSSDQFATSQK